MRHIFLLYGCVVLMVMVIGTTYAESFSDARSHAAALIFLVCITADNMSRK